MVDRHKAGFPNVKPNVRTYNAVLDCLSKAREEERAEQLLFDMLNLYRHGDDDATPDSFSFNCVIRAFCRSRAKGTGRRAETVLDRLLEYSQE
jgi:pentatricopeptide repeat protein